MWHLTVRFLYRFVAKAVGERIIKVVSWWGRRYAFWLLLILVMFLVLSVANNHVGRWADHVGVFLGLFVPVVVAVLTVYVFCWAIEARAITPIKPSEVLNWAEDEMEPEITEDQREEGLVQEK